MSTAYIQKQSPAQKKDVSSASAVLDNSSQSESLQRKADMANNAAQREETPRPNNTGMPDNLKSGIESLSGFSMDDVRVHYNSSKPATVQALAYTQGTDIHVAPGQEKHLPHEAWHVAQQMAGRVSPTTNINGMPVNDNAALEHEADVMGEKAVQCKKTTLPQKSENRVVEVTQCAGDKSGKKAIKARRNSRKAERRERKYLGKLRLKQEQFERQRLEQERLEPKLQEQEINLRNHPRFEGRDDPSADTYGYEASAMIGTEKCTLHRDHIIPHSLLMRFLNKLDLLHVRNKMSTEELAWRTSAKRVFFGNVDQVKDDSEEKKTEKKRDGFFRGGYKQEWLSPEDDESLVEIVQRAIGWMPGNVFLAPCPKTDDQKGDVFDITFASAFKTQDAACRVVKKYKETYDFILSFVRGSDVSLYQKKRMFNNLNYIANYRNFWNIIPKNWSYKGDEDRSYPRFIYQGDDVVKKNGFEESKTIDVFTKQKTEWSKEDNKVKKTKRILEDQKNALKKLPKKLNSFEDYIIRFKTYKLIAQCIKKMTYDVYMKEKDRIEKDVNHIKEITNQLTSKYNNKSAKKKKK